MLRKFFKIKGSTIFGGAMILGIFSVISRILGVLRDRIFASTFGAGDDLDAYYAAFRIPDFIFNLLVLGALVSSFIPVFTDYMAKKKEDEAWHVACSILNIITLAVFVCSVFVFIFVKDLIFLIAPGFTPEKQELCANLTKIMLVSPIFFSISNIATSILNSFKKFFTYALAPSLYNLGIIIGALFLTSKFGIYGLALGVVLGAFLQMVIQWPGVFALGFRFRFVFDFTHEGVKKIGHLMLPRVLGLAADQLNLWVITVIASSAAVGSVAVFNLASNLQSFPVGIFAIPFTIAAFPYLSEAFSKNDPISFKRNFSSTFSRILFFIIPSSIFLLVLRAQIVRLILGAGKFDWEDTYLTAQSLGFFTLSLFAQALIHLLARAFYSMHDTKTPVACSFVALFINVIGCLVFVKSLGVMGLALAFSVASFVNMALLLILLRTRVGDLNDNQIIKNNFKVIFASLIAGFVCWRVLYLIAPHVNMQTGLGILLQTAGAGLMGTFVYFIFAWLFRCEEIKSALVFFKK